MIQVSAPGKIHLIGEHSAVYGKPAILAAINLRFFAKISKSEKKEIIGIVQYDNAIKDFQNNLEKLISKKYAVKQIPNYKIEFKNELPLGSGLGSSAAFCAIFTAALLKFLKIKFDLNTLNELTFEGEKIFQGNPSGGDNTVVVFGGLIWFKKESDHANVFTPLEVNSKIKNFLLIDSGKPVESTAEMVSGVSSRSAGNSKYLTIFNDQGKLAKEMANALKDTDQKLFMKIITKAEKNLEKLGVVGKTAKSIIRQIEKLDGAAKITGGGGIKKGSGMILAFHQDLSRLIKFARENQLKYYSVEISDKGVAY